MKNTLFCLLSLSLASRLLGAEEKKPDAPAPAPAPAPVQTGDPSKIGRGENLEKEVVRKAIEKQREAKLKELLIKYDKNGDGKIDAEERAAARTEFRKSGRKPAPTGEKTAPQKDAAKPPAQAK